VVQGANADTGPLGNRRYRRRRVGEEHLTRSPQDQLVVLRRLRLAAPQPDWITGHVTHPNT
jgi:hypothetical protein